MFNSFKQWYEGDYLPWKQSGKRGKMKLDVLYVPAMVSRFITSMLHIKQYLLQLHNGQQEGVEQELDEFLDLLDTCNGSLSHTLVELTMAGCGKDGCIEEDVNAVIDSFCIGKMRERVMNGKPLYSFDVKDKLDKLNTKTGLPFGYGELTIKFCHRP